MLEDSKEQAPKISRRTALKVMAGGGAAIALGSQEARTIEEGVQTKAGIFYPLYHRHDHPIEVKDIPPDLDGYFVETIHFRVTKEPMYTVSEMVSGNYIVFRDDNKVTVINQPLMNEDSLNFLSHNQAKLIFGDIILRDRDFSIHNWGLKIRALLATTLLMGVLKNDQTDKTAEHGVSSPTRRMFLRKIALASVAIISAPMVGNIFTLLGMTPNPDQRNALQRILVRVGGMLEHAAPENNIIFFRNLIMANQLLTVAEKIFQELNRKPRIGLDVGARHSGIEDFLTVGHEFTRWLIKQYPRSFLEEIAQKNGGMEEFLSASLISLPADYNFNSDSIGEINLNPELRERLQKVMRLQRATDQPLLEALKS